VNKQQEGGSLALNPIPIGNVGFKQEFDPATIKKNRTVGQNFLGDTLNNRDLKWDK